MEQEEGYEADESRGESNSINSVILKVSPKLVPTKAKKCCTLKAKPLSFELQTQYYDIERVGWKVVISLIVFNIVQTFAFAWVLISARPYPVA